MKKPIKVDPDFLAQLVAERAAALEAVAALTNIIARMSKKRK